jgi:hypothetical protein
MGVGTGSGNPATGRPMIRGFTDIELIVVVLTCRGPLSNAATSNRSKPLFWGAMALIRPPAGSSSFDAAICWGCSHEPGAFNFAWAVTE